MIRFPMSKQRRHRAILTGGLGALLLVSACSYWRVWSYRDLIVYCHARSHSPVGGALWRGEIAAGSRIDRVLAMATPHRTNTLGPFLTVYYLPGGVPSPDSICLEGTALTAKDGRLISAASYGCTFQRTYFNVSTTDENELLARLLRERIDANSKAMR